jgi:hypothetical protein
MPLPRRRAPPTLLLVLAGRRWIAGHWGDLGIEGPRDSYTWSLINGPFSGLFTGLLLSCYVGLNMKQQRSMLKKKRSNGVLKNSDSIVLFVNSFPSFFLLFVRYNKL